MENTISRTEISKRTERKRNTELVDTINLAKKNNLLDLAKRLSAPLSQYTIINLDQINHIKEDKLIVVGKVLGQGELHKKVKIAALGFSESAKLKLKKNGSEFLSIKHELEKNHELGGFKVL